MEGMALLERTIRQQLYGEDGCSGLVRGLMSCQTLEDLRRQQGMIAAYETVLGMMEQVYRQLHEPAEPRPRMYS